MGASPSNSDSLFFKVAISRFAKVKRFFNSRGDSSSLTCFCFAHRHSAEYGDRLGIDTSTPIMSSNATLALFLIFLARSPKRKVDSDSAAWVLSGVQHMIKVVLLFPVSNSYIDNTAYSALQTFMLSSPPSASIRIRVSFESLYGT